jgi:hypothetical protein
MTRISTGTVTIANGATIFTVWDGDDDVVLSEITAPAGSPVVIEGVANFIKTRLSTVSAELVLPHAGAGGALLACAISAMTPAETQVGTLNARVATVIQGLDVVQANGVGLFYRFSDTTSDSDPGPGYLQFNNPDPALVTEIYVDDLSASNFDVGALLDAWGTSSSPVKGTLALASATNDGRFGGYELTGAVVVNTGYRTLPVAAIGDPSAWSAEDALMLTFAPKGNVGAGFVTDATVANPPELVALEGEASGYLVFVSDLQTDFGAYSGRSGVVELIAGPDWQLVAMYTGPKGEDSIVPGPTGPKGINWRGAYNGGTAYVEDDGVLDNGSSWRALGPTTGNAPPALPTTNNAYWQLVARRGTDGAGTGDVVGPLSSTNNAIARFDGTTGKLLKELGSGVANADMAVMGEATVKGRAVGSGTSIPADLTGAQVAAIVMAGGQLAFPATQIPSANANTLDDYEEGTYTPTYTNITIGNGTVSSKYTKVGDLIHLEWSITWGSTTSATASPTTIGLPFTAGADGAGSASALDFGSAFFHPIVFRSTTSMVPRSPSAGSYSGTVPFTWTTGDVLTITTTYKV